MPFNGSGVYTPPGTDFPAVSGTLITAVHFNNVVNDIATALSNAVTRDGQSPATANIPMGGFKHVNVVDGTSRASPTAHYASLGQAQDSTALWAGTAGGTADALTLALSPAIPAYVAGQAFLFKSGATPNATTTPTVAISGLAVKTIQNDGGALVAGDIAASKWYRIVYDGANFQLQRISSADFAAVGAYMAAMRTADAVSGNVTLTVADNFHTKVVSATATLTLAAASTLAVGDSIFFKSITTGAVLIAPAGADTIDGFNASYRLPAFRNCEIMKTGAGAFALVQTPSFNVGDFVWAGQGTANNGLIKAGTAPVSRTTYASLFAVYGTTWGAGDGATTFGLPDGRGKGLVQAGTGTIVDVATASSGNGWTIPANNTKWQTGQPVVLSNLTGFTTSATAGPTYFVARISSTNIRLATTLALAQNLTPDVTVSGAGTVTFTGTLTARVLGEYGGEEAHAMSITELLSHIHGTSLVQAGAGVSALAGGASFPSGNTAATGGNAAANIMQPFLVGELYIQA